MHQAEQTHTTARRKFLAGIAAIPLLTTGICPADAEDAADAELLRHCAAYMALANIVTNASPEATDVEMAPVYEKQWNLLDTIAVCPAKTLCGVKAKAQVAKSVLPEYLEDFQADCANSEIKLIFGILTDIQEIM